MDLMHSSYVYYVHLNWLISMVNISSTIIKINWSSFLPTKDLAKKEVRENVLPLLKCTETRMRQIL